MEGLAGFPVWTESRRYGGNDVGRENVCSNEEDGAVPGRCLEGNVAVDETGRRRMRVVSPQEEAAVAVLRTAGVLTQRLTEVLRPHGLTPTQYNVLRILRGGGPAGLTCGDVAERMLDPNPDVTRLLDRLQRRGLLSRQRNPGDRRQVVSVISPAGLELLHSLDAVLEEFNRGQLAGLDGDDLRALQGLLARIRA